MAYNFAPKDTLIFKNDAFEVPKKRFTVAWARKGLLNVYLINIIDAEEEGKSN